MPRDRAQQARILHEALFGALAAVAAAHSVTLPERGTPHEIAEAFAALTGRVRHEGILVDAMPHTGWAHLTISHAWDEKRHLIEEVRDSINEDPVPISAALEGGALKLRYKEDADVD